MTKLNRTILVTLMLSNLLMIGCAGNHAPKNGFKLSSVFKDLHSSIQDSLSPAVQAEKIADEALENAQIDKALYYYVQSLEYDSENPGILFKIAQIHEQRGNESLSETAFRYTLNKDEDHPGALESLGLLRLKNNDFKNAKLYLIRALENDEERWRSANALGIIGDLEKQHEQALEFYRQALEINPGNQKVLNNLAYSYYLQGDKQRAIDIFEKILDHDPENKKVWNNLGLVLVRQGKYKQAITAFNKIMDMANTYNTIGYLIMIESKRYTPKEDTDKLSLAKSYFEKAIEASPRYFSQAHDNLDKLSNFYTS